MDEACNVWERSKMHAHFLSGRSKERHSLEDIGVYGKILKRTRSKVTASKLDSND